MNKWILFFLSLIILSGFAAILLFRFWKYLNKDDEDDEILGI